jgi:hypothetical protein
MPSVLFFIANIRLLGSDFQYFCEARQACPWGSKYGAVVSTHDTHSVVNACAEPRSRPAASIVDRIAIFVNFSSCEVWTERKTKLEAAGGHEELFELLSVFQNPASSSTAEFLTIVAKELEAEDLPNTYKG